MLLVLFSVGADVVLRFIARLRRTIGNRKTTGENHHLNLKLVKQIRRAKFVDLRYLYL